MAEPHNPGVEQMRQRPLLVASGRCSDGRLSTQSRRLPKTISNSSYTAAFERPHRPLICRLWVSSPGRAIWWGTAAGRSIQMKRHQVALSALLIDS